jgi:hypothetical protein
MLKDISIAATDFSPEIRLLLYCLQHSPDEIDSLGVKQLYTSGINWDIFIELIDKHRVAPNIYRKIQKLKNGILPEHIYEVLKIRYQKDLANALNITAELVRLTTLFNQNNIPVISVKGPVLAVLLHGDCGARSYGDLDFLIPIAYYEKTDWLLRKAGYKNVYFELPLNKNQFAYLSKSIHHFGYTSNERRLSVEIHWRFFDYSRYFTCDFFQLQQTAQKITISGTAVQTLSDQDTHLYLYAHGAIHCWYRLKWLCDVVDFSEKYAPINWDQLIERSIELGMRRALAQGALLAHTLLEMTLNDKVRMLINDEKIIPKLVHNACKVIKQKENRTLPTGREWITIKMNILNLKKDSGYKLATILQDLRVSPEDMYTVHLPDKLFFLYYILRPILIIWRNLLKSNRIKK